VTELHRPGSRAVRVVRDGRLATSESGARLRTLRRAAGLTQRELADRAGVSLECVWTVENGLKRPRRATVGLLAGALGVGPAVLAEAPHPRVGLPAADQAAFKCPV
jgi:transcriptional regulator with XRE-family HTH domain